MMKKWTAYIILAVIITTLTGCGEEENVTSGPVTQEPVSMQETEDKSGDTSSGYEPGGSLQEESEYDNTDAMWEMIVEPEQGKEYYEERSPQENAVDFTGEWSRTKVIRPYEAYLTISNQDAEGFDVSGETYWYAHMGNLYEERAYFVSENGAVLEYYNESLETYSYLIFLLEDGNLRVWATGTGADFEAGANCFWHGEYVQGEPVYENVNVMQDTFTEEELETIGNLLGEEQFEEMFVFTTENGSVIEENCTLADGTAATFYNAFVPGVANYNYYNLLIDVNGAIYIEIGPDGMFYSTEDGLTEMPQYTTAG